MLSLKFLQLLDPTGQPAALPDEPLAGLTDLVDQRITGVWLGVNH
jgi:hypothetical protein